MKKTILIFIISIFALSITKAQYDFDNQGILFKSNGFIGIGTDNPQRILHTSIADNKVQLRLERTGTNPGYVDLGNINGNFSIWAGGYSDAKKHFTIKSDNGFIGVGTDNPQKILHTSIADNKVQLRLERTGTNPGYVDLGNINGNFSIWAGGYSDAKKHFTIKSDNGFIGVGTDNPQKILHTSIADNKVQLRLERTGTNPGYVDLGNINGDFSIWAGGYSDTKKHFTIKSDNGFVGIGTDNPERVLQSTAKDNRIQLRLERIGTNSGYVDLGGMNGDFSIWAGGYDNGNKFIIKSSNGFVGIGCELPNHTLDVAGTIRAEEVKVNLNGCDFVFEDDYKLRTLSEVENFIKENNRLPEIESALQMEVDGTNLGELNSKLLQKIEELTLYTIAQQKEIEELKKQNTEIEKIKEELELLKTSR